MEDVLRLLDGLFEQGADRWTAGASSWWDGFYADRERPVPFFVARADENLVSYVERGLISPGRALDLGCGPGRNALHLAALGFEVDAVDLSPKAIAWAEDRARETGAEVRFHCGDAFAHVGDGDGDDGDGQGGGDGEGPGAGPAGALTGPYDLIHDSGCFHHLPPHRRVSYLALLDRALAPGGHLGLTCFAAGETGCELGDADLYRNSRLDGGLAYAAQSLRWIFSELTEIELRRMRDEPEDSPHFGEPFLWTALFRRESR